MKKRAIILALLLSLILTSCISTTQMADQALAEGSYIKAIELSLDALNEDPGDQQALLVLTSSWNQANGQWRAKIEELLASESTSQQEAALGYYRDLITIHTLVANSGGWNLDPDPDAIQADFDQSREQIARAYINDGSELLYTETREGAREAAALFAKAFDIYPDLKNTFSYLYDRAMEQGTIRLFIFTGPDTNFAINGIRMIAHIEDLVDNMEFVEAVRVPNRYAAPVDDDHGAKDFARGHRADMMLHIEPDTTYSGRSKKDQEPLSSAPWTKETTYLEAEARSQLRLVLIDLSDDSIISDTSITVEQRQISDLALQAILGPNTTQSLNLTALNGERKLYVQKAPSSVNPMTLAHNLTNLDGLNLPKWGFETGVQPAFTEPMDLSGYTTLSDLNRLSSLSDHTFLLFDLLEFQDTDGSYYQFVYGAYLGEGPGGRLATSAYDRKVYTELKAKLNDRNIQNSFTEDFLTQFYEKRIGEEILKATSDLL